MGVVGESGHFVITLTHGMTNGPLRINYPFILCENHALKGNLCWKYSSPLVFAKKRISCILCKHLGQDHYQDTRRFPPLIVVEIGLGPLLVCVRHPEPFFGTWSLPQTSFSTPGPCFSTEGPETLGKVSPRLKLPFPRPSFHPTDWFSNCAILVPAAAGRGKKIVCEFFFVANV